MSFREIAIDWSKDTCAPVTSQLRARRSSYFTCKGSRRAQGFNRTKGTRGLVGAWRLLAALGFCFLGFCFWVFLPKIGQLGAMVDGEARL